MSEHLLDLGDSARGQVLDERAWQAESRCKAAHPPRVVTGTVRTVFLHAPHVVGITTPAGEHLTIRAHRAHR